MKRWKKILVCTSLACGSLSGFGCLQENVKTVLPLAAAIAVIGGVIGIIITIKNR